MKTKLFICSLPIVFMFLACEDFSSLGTSVKPDTDNVSIYDATIGITAKTIRVNSVYAKTVKGSLGNYYDPDFGSVNAGYACEFYPSLGFIDVDSVENGKIDSVYLSMHYKYVGDSLAPMGLTVYPLNKALERHYYTDVNPAEFADMTKPLTKFAYTARNLDVSDSLLAAVGYDYNLYVELPTEIGQKLFDKATNKEDSTIFTNLDDFRKFFPGLYIASTYGTGSMLNNINTEIHIYYTAGTSHRWATLAVTNEVVQVNSFKNSNDEFLTNNNDTATYIKSPAGVYTEISIPVGEIMQGVGDKLFSTVSLSLTPYTPSEWEYALPFPGSVHTSTELSKLLLIRQDSLQKFFEEQKVADGATTFSTIFNTSTYSYDFQNIANVVQDFIDNKPETDTLKLLLVPVQTSWTYATVNDTQVATDYATLPSLALSGVKLKTGKDDLKIRVTASSTNTDN
ncbi:MAG: DUF4270 domain-containing protein [Dysgonamonadaceae bacterium]|jgi:hypothetical protein|nr:DUF4270 domain-containing protein [Dysgonamonadaceae bacterium]